MMHNIRKALDVEMSDDRGTSHDSDKLDGSILRKHDFRYRFTWIQRKLLRHNKSKQQHLIHCVS